MNNKNDINKITKSIKITRRDLLKSMIATGLISFSGLDLSWAAKESKVIKRKIPGTNELIPVMGLGSSDTFETAGGENTEPLKEVLRLFYKMGGRVVDTSPTYGNAENVIGKLGSRLAILDDLFLATKVHERGKEEGIHQMERSESLLQTKPLDLIQVHNLIDVETQLGTLREWKNEGRVRYIGITHYLTSAFDELERLMKKEKMDFIQFNYSILTPDAEKRLLPLAADKGIAVIVNRTFEDGRLFRETKGKKLPVWASEFDCNSWAQFSLKYVLSHPAVTCAIPATSKPKHLVDNMGAGTGKLPDKKTRGRMLKYMRSI